MRVIESLGFAFDPVDFTYVYVKCWVLFELSLVIDVWILLSTA
jgi:hypothetical protein